MKGERAAAYIRVSTQEQKLRGLSLDAQKMTLSNYADSHNLQIISWYMDEGISGRKLIKKRPALQQMIKDAENGKFDRIIFIKLDRYFRSVAEYHECQKILDASGVTWTATEEVFDLTTANGRYWVNQKLAMAEYEADQTGERIRLVNEYKVKSGLPLYGEQSLPFCFTIKQIDGQKRVVKNPETQEVMYDLLDHFKTHQSKRATAIYINKKYGIPMDLKIITNLLKNPLICGEYRGNPSYCEAYLTREEFNRIQELASRNVRTKARRSYLFTGLLRCPDCGNTLTGCGSPYTARDGSLQYSKYYRCNKHYKSDRCSFNLSVGENKVERMLLDRIEKCFADFKVRSARISEKEEKQIIDLKAIQAEMERLNYAWQKGRIKNVEDYDRQYDELDAVLQAARKSKNTAPDRDYSHIDELLSGDWKTLYDALDESNKRAFWRSFISGIEIEWTPETRRLLHIEFF